MPGARLDALAAVDALVTDFPWSAEARGARGEIRAFTGDATGARTDLAWAIARGYAPRPDALARAGMSASD